VALGARQGAPHRARRRAGAVRAAATGNDLFALDAALERLERRGSQSVRSAVGWSSSASPFQVAEDLCRGDAARAVAGLEALFPRGFEERDGTRETDLNALLAVLFGALRSKVRQSLTGARVMASGGDLARAAEAAGVGGNPKARAEFEARVSARPAGACARCCSTWPSSSAPAARAARGFERPGALRPALGAAPARGAG
jgi:hypothetical protein